MPQSPECIKMHRFEGENTFFFLGGAVPLPDLPDLTLLGEGISHPIGAFGASIRVPLALNTQPHFWLRAMDNEPCPVQFS